MREAEEVSTQVHYHLILVHRTPAPPEPEIGHGSAEPLSQAAPRGAGPPQLARLCPFKAPPPTTPLVPWGDVTRRTANGNTAYWQAVPAAAAKGEVSRGWSDGPGLDPAASAAAATCLSGAGAAGTGAGTGVAADVGAVRVSCHESPVAEHLRVLAAGVALSTAPHDPQGRTAGLGSPPSQN